MNFNVYLDDVTAEKLKRLARQTHATRNALVRKAVDAYLEHAASEWPAIVTAYEGAEPVRPFEAERDELAAAVVDPFTVARTPRGRRRKKTRP